MKMEWWIWKSLFWAFSVTPLERWGVVKSCEWRLGGEGRWLVGAQKSVPSEAVKKGFLAAIGFHGTLL